jgi:hypothetical protein
MAYFCSMKKNKIVLTGSLLLGVVLLNASFNKVTAQELAFNDTPPAKSHVTSYPAQPAQAQKPALLSAVEPAFPGGEDSLQNYLFMHVNTPDSLWARDISGSIYFSFFVESDGKIDKVKIEKSPAAPGWDSAMINCVRTMPKWIPGSVNNQPKAMRCFLPVSFPPGHQLYNLPDSVSIK